MPTAHARRALTRLGVPGDGGTPGAGAEGADDLLRVDQRTGVGVQRCPEELRDPAQGDPLTASGLDSGVSGRLCFLHFTQVDRALLDQLRGAPS